MNIFLGIAFLIVIIGIFSFTMSKIEKTPRNLIFAALFAALTVVGTWIKIPLPFIPITMQVFFVIFAGALLGSKLGLISQLIFMLIGLIGVPVFSFGGGLDSIFMPSFGYIIGFALAAFTTGLIIEKAKKRNFYTYLFASCAGILVIYLCGVPYLYFINTIYLAKPFTIKAAIYYGFVVFLGKDIVSATMLSIILPTVSKALNYNMQSTASN